MSTTPTTETIATFWQRDDKTIKEERLDLAFRRLKSTADGYIVTCETNLLDAQAALDKARSASMANPNFSVIVDSQLRMRAAQLTLKEALSVYAAQFGKA
jgi:hypothetical protein